MRVLPQSPRDWVLLAVATATVVIMAVTPFYLAYTLASGRLLH